MPRLLAGLLLSVASAAFLLFSVDVSEAVQAVGNANPLLVAVAIGCLVGSVAARTLRWRNLLPQDPPAAAGRLYRILHVSYLLNNVLPIRLGDVARIAATARVPGMRVGAVVSSMVAERLADALVLIGAFLLVSLFAPLPPAYHPWLLAAWAGIGVLFASLVLMTSIGRLRRPRSVARVGGTSRAGAAARPSRVRDELRAFARGFPRLLHGSSFRGVWGWSAVAWLGAFAINYFLIRAVGIHAPWTAAVLLTCTTNAVMLVPSSPGYIGVFHAAAVLVLLPFGVPEESALGLAILAHLVNVLPVSLIGLGFLVADHETLGLVRSTAVAADTPTGRVA